MLLPGENRPSFVSGIFMRVEDTIVFVVVVVVFSVGRVLFHWLSGCLRYFLNLILIFYMIFFQYCTFEFDRYLGK